MKYYIPTSTLNFNSILASESISPAGFYKRRTTGYRAIEAVPINNFDSAIALYRAYPQYNMGAAAGYPLVIEVDESAFDTKGIRPNDEILFFASETIRLNPLTTRFVFRNQKEMQETINAAARNIETKLVKLYQSHSAFITCAKLETERVEQTNANAQNPSPFIDKNAANEQVGKDAWIDRIKGALWGYIIGENLSRSNPSQYAELHQLLEVSPSEEAYSTLRQRLDKALRNIDEGPAFARKRLGRNIFPQTKIDSRGRLFLDTLPASTCEDEKRATFILNATISNSPIFTQSKSEYVSFVAVQLHERNLADEQLINELLALFSSMDGSQAFDTDSVKDESMRSFCIFCRKANKDNFDDLPSYLYRSNISHLGFALALWGAVYGYSSLPKTVIDREIGLYDPTYTDDVIAHIFKQTTGRGIVLGASAGLEDDTSFPNSNIAVEKVGQTGSTASIAENPGDKWKNELQQAWPDLYEQYDDKEKARYKNKPWANKDIEEIISECSSIDEFDKNINDIWKERPKEGKKMRDALHEFVRSWKQAHDSKR